jgi:hypothetical protein
MREHGSPCAPLQPTVRRCPVPRTSWPSVAVLLTTTRHYLETRLRHTLTSWPRAAQALLISSDVAIPHLNGDIGLVVIPSSLSDAFVPPWKHLSRNARRPNGSPLAATPAGQLEKHEQFLRDRTIVALDVLHRCLPSTSILLADDDTYFPWPMLAGRFGDANLAEPHLFGTPVVSFARTLGGGSLGRGRIRGHCAGGDGVLFSRGLLQLLDRAGGGVRTACCTYPLPMSIHVDVSLGMCAAVAVLRNGTAGDGRVAGCERPAGVATWGRHVPRNTSVADLYADRAAPNRQRPPGRERRVS